MGEKKGKKKVVIVLDNLRRGGIEIAALRFFELLDSEEDEATFLLRNLLHYDESMVKTLEKRGAKIIVKPESTNSYLKDYFFFKKLFKKEKYDIVHAHLLFYNGIIMCAAYKAGVGKRIAHSHATEENRVMGKLKKTAGDIYHAIMRAVIGKYATDIVGCSKKAGEYMCGKRLFGERGTVLPNYVNIDEYSFSGESRLLKRKEFGLADELLIGHTGSIYWIKNQTFLVELLAGLLKVCPNARLMLVGEEADGGKTRALAKKLNVADKVIFTGSRDDIPELLCAMDIFMFPSRFEALPIAPIEAQASGLPCIVSTGVTEEIKATDSFVRLSLDVPSAQWIKKILEFSALDRNKSDLTELKARYSAQSVAGKLKKLYES